MTAQTSSGTVCAPLLIYTFGCTLDCAGLASAVVLDSMFSARTSWSCAILGAMLSWPFAI